MIQLSQDTMTMNLRMRRYLFLLYQSFINHFLNYRFQLCQLEILEKESNDKATDQLTHPVLIPSLREDC